MVLKSCRVFLLVHGSVKFNDLFGRHEASHVTEVALHELD